MGEAKRRGNREQRIATAAPRPPKEAPTYKFVQPYRNRALDFLWDKFFVFDGVTVKDFVAKAKADQRKANEAAAIRASQEAQAHGAVSEG